jgi:hypothetical protein
VVGVIVGSVVAVVSTAITVWPTVGVCCGAAAVCVAEAEEADSEVS